MSELIPLGLRGLELHEALDDGDEPGEVVVVAVAEESAPEENRSVECEPHEISFRREVEAFLGDVGDRPSELGGDCCVGLLRGGANLLPDLLLDNVGLRSGAKLLEGVAADESCVVAEGVDEEV